MQARPLLWAAALCWLPLSLPAAELRWSSADSAASVIELYTSEGCNSCPPAEAWLNGLADHPDLWRRFIPLAFHVDYWDYLGWQDPFASPRHSARQRSYARSDAVSTVYTPAFVVDGREWRRGWLRSTLPSAAPRAGVLTAQVSDATVTAALDPRSQAEQPLVLNVALLGMGLVSEIHAGENRGRRSRHEFVVLGWNQSRAGDPWRLAIPAPQVAADRYALAVWLSHADQPQPLLAVGGYLPEHWNPPAASQP